MSQATLLPELLHCWSVPVICCRPLGTQHPIISRPAAGHLERP
jgi:hypothetical protein